MKTLKFGNKEGVLLLISAFEVGVVIGLVAPASVRTESMLLMFVVGSIGGVVAAVASAVMNHPDFPDYL